MEYLLAPILMALAGVILAQICTPDSRLNRHLYKKRHSHKVMEENFQSSKEILDSIEDLPK